MRSAARLATVLAAGFCVGLVASPGARGAQPPRFGGQLRLVAPAPVISLDPSEASSPFEAALAAAIAETLYLIDDHDRPQPLLAAGMPVVEGNVATIRLRPGLRRHGGSPLAASGVASSLRRAARAPKVRWLFTGFNWQAGSPDIRATADDTIEVRLASSHVDVARIFAAAPLAIVTGRDPRRQPSGTGPFSARLSSTGDVRLQAFAFAAEGAPYLDAIHVLPPRSREDALRAFELGQVDTSWHGESLYGGRPVRPVTSLTSPPAAPVLLVPNLASGALRADGTWAALAARVDRRRLERAGLFPATTLAAGIPPPRLPASRPPAGRVTITMPVVAGDAFAARLAEAIAGVCDESGFTLRVEQLSPQRYASVISSGAWNLRLVTVVPPVPGATPLVGAALAAAGQGSLASRLSDGGSLADPSRGVEAAPALEALVLGRRRETLSYRADLGGVRFGRTGILALPSFAFARGATGGDPP